MAAAETKKRDNIPENVYLEVFGVTDYESVLDFQNSKWRIQNWDR